MESFIDDFLNFSIYFSEGVDMTMQFFLGMGRLLFGVYRGTDMGCS